MKTHWIIGLTLVGVGLGCAPRVDAPSSAPAGEPFQEAPAVPDQPERDAAEAPVSGGEGVLPPSSTPPTSPAPPSMPVDFHAPLWEKARKEGSSWTRFVIDLQRTVATGLHDGAEDVTAFCPAFYKMNREQRENFWVVLLAGITKYESNFDPTVRYVEKTMGKDPVTGQQVASEGLLQLSYQDGRSYSFCKEFDWNADRHLAPRDPRKTILNPHRNLRCGIQILQYQIRKSGKIAPVKGNYWAVLIPGGKYSKVAEIKKITAAMKTCH